MSTIKEKEYPDNKISISIPKLGKYAVNEILPDNDFKLESPKSQSESYSEGEKIFEFRDYIVGTLKVNYQNDSGRKKIASNRACYVNSQIKKIASKVLAESTIRFNIYKILLDVINNDSINMSKIESSYRFLENEHCLILTSLFSREMVCIKDYIHDITFKSNYFLSPYDSFLYKRDFWGKSNGFSEEWIMSSLIDGNMKAKYYKNSLEGKGNDDLKSINNYDIYDNFSKGKKMEDWKLGESILKTNYKVTPKSILSGSKLDLDLFLEGEYQYNEFFIFELTYGIHYIKIIGPLFISLLVNDSIDSSEEFNWVHKEWKSYINEIRHQHIYNNGGIIRKPSIIISFLEKLVDVESSNELLGWNLNDENKWNDWTSVRNLFSFVLILSLVN